MSLRNTTLIWALLGALVVFIPFSALTPRTDAFEVMNAMIGTFALTVFAANCGRSYQVLKLPAHDLRASHILTVAISLGSLAIGATFVGLWVWRAFPNWEWIVSSWPVLLTRWLILCAFVLTMAVHFNHDGVITTAGWRKVTTLLIGAAILAITLIVVGVNYGDS